MKEKFPPLLSRTRYGSAILVVIGVISVIIIILLGYFRSNVSRQFSTRLMSNEKKAEALAEAAAELILRLVKDKMNDTTDPNIYTYFRFPAPLIGGKIGNGTGANNPLDLSGYVASLSYVYAHGAPPPGLAPLTSLIQELGGAANVKTLSVECGFVSAEAFTSKRADYAVAGISQKAHEATGDPAKFLDDIAVSPTSGGYSIQNMSLLGIINFTFNLPQPIPAPTKITPIGSSDQHSIDVPSPADGKVTLTKTGDLTVSAHIKVKAPIIGTIFDDTITVDFEAMFRKYVKFPAGAPLTIESLFDDAMPVGKNKKGLSWSASTLHSAIRAGWDRLSSQVQAKKSTAFGSTPEVIEKGGVFRLLVEVEYLPNGPGGPLIKRTLVADREYKVSDIQPVAPEYTFFHANSPNLEEPAGDTGIAFGGPVTWRTPVGYSALGIATVSFHNAPEGDVGKADGFQGGSVDADSKCQVPGMLRVNANGLMEINTFLGTMDEPKVTEFNAVAEYNSSREFNYIPVFQWKDRTVTRDHEVDFPVLKEADYTATPYIPTGVANLMNVFNLCDAITPPVLFFGTGHFEYPLSLRMEAPLQMRWSNIKIQVDPIGKASDPKDRTEVFIYYQNLSRPFGLKNEPAYSSVSDWSPTSWANMPANLYSLLQYAKKATHFYESETEFKNDIAKPVADGGRGDGGVFDCTGVTYVKGDLHLGAMQVKGKGIVVAKGNIYVTGDITRADSDTVFSLIARRGALLVSSPCHKIQASIYSHLSPQNAAGNTLAIDGNLVVNEFRRAAFRAGEVFFNSAACRITPLSVMRDVGKFEPRRYIVGLGKGWSRFEFRKQ